ncbi:MAG: uL15 family ribosomal protein [Candidatus Niyogibacteria bacterium]|nr:uL15 family ribosomal protein [Candidatus Niyogibacteria bacterium]
MQLHEIKPKSKKKPQKRIGRGGKRGTYSGRGIKGQRSRAGHKIRPALRDIIKKIPKLRGYRMKIVPENTVGINLSVFGAKVFEDGAKITPQILEKKGFVRRSGRVLPRVKILGGGELEKKLVFSGFIFSKSAREKIGKAGGVVSEDKKA